MTATDRITEFFGPERFATMQTSEAGTSHGIVYSDEEATGRLGGYRIGGNAAPLSSDQLAQLQRALADADLYEFEVTKRVPFRPDIGVECREGDKTAIFLLDTRRTKIGWTEGQEVQSVDVHPSSEAFGAILTVLASR